MSSLVKKVSIAICNQLYTKIFALARCFAKKTAAEALFLRLGGAPPPPASGPAAPWAFIYSSKLENFCAGGRRLISWMLSSTSGAALWRRTASCAVCGAGASALFFFRPWPGPALAPQGRGGVTGAAACASAAFCRGYACARRGVGRALALRGARQHFFLFSSMAVFSCSVFCPPGAARMPRTGVPNCAGQAWARTGMVRFISFSISARYAKFVLAAKADGTAAFPRAARAPDAMHIRLRHVGKVVVEHMESPLTSMPRAAISVATSTRSSPAFEAPQRLLARRLAFVAVDGHGLHPGGRKLFHHAVRAVLGACEHKRAVHPWARAEAGPAGAFCCPCLQSTHTALSPPLWWRAARPAHTPGCAEGFAPVRVSLPAWWR